MINRFKLIFVKIVIFHIRGGGELGDGWLLKPLEAENSFEDLIAGVEHLKGETYNKIIDPNKIAYYGVSHGSKISIVAYFQQNAIRLKSNILICHPLKAD